MKFKRAEGAKVEVNWNPHKGQERPYEGVINNFALAKYRNKPVVTMNDQYYQVVKSWYDFHPNLHNGAVLAPLEVIS